MSFFSELSPEMDLYLEQHTSSESEILKNLREETFSNVANPHMVSGIQQGRFLSIISKMLQPQNILELGTFTGYATLCLAEGLSKNGKITTIDVNEEIYPIAKKYFEISNFASQIDFKLEKAVDFLNSTDEIFDLVFIDANKSAYVEYFHLLKSKIKSGGILLFDNVLWYGKVLEENPKKKMTKIIKELNDLACKDEDFDSVILPLRDGIHLLRKK